MLGWGESGLTKCIERILCIHKLKLMFDTFQHGYKLEYKFFAGLHYFLYRTLIYVIVMIAPTQSVSDLQLMLLVVLFAILVIHLISMPFKSPADNKAHSLVYVLLIILIILYLFVTDDDDIFTWDCVVIHPPPISSCLHYMYMEIMAAIPESFLFTPENFPFKNAVWCGVRRLYYI